MTWEKIKTPCGWATVREVGFGNAIRVSCPCGVSCDYSRTSVDAIQEADRQMTLTAAFGDWHDSPTRTGAVA